MTRQSAVKDFIYAREGIPDSGSSSCEREKKLFIDFFYAEIIFYFPYNFEGSKTDSCNVVNMSNFFLSFCFHFTSIPIPFRINKDGLKCLLSWSPFSHLFSLYFSRVCVLQACFVLKCLYQFSQFQCLLHFDFLFFSPNRI